MWSALHVKSAVGQDINMPTIPTISQYPLLSYVIPMLIESVVFRLPSHEGDTEMHV